MRPIVSFDLDMTLLDHETFEIPESAMRAVEMLRERYVVVIATGRDMDSRFSRRFRDQVKPEAIIHTNGTKITVGDRILYESYMARELKKDLLEFAGEHNLAVGVTIGDDDYYINSHLVTEFDMSRWGECGRRDQDPWTLLDMDVPSMCYIGGPEGAALMERAFEDLKFPLFAENRGADIIEKKNSKANGLEMLCEYFGTTMEEAYAFGDSMNDYEIIQAAGTGIAMDNGNPRLKAVADYVAPHIREDGIYKACRALGLIEAEKGESRPAGQDGSQKEAVAKEG